MEITLKEVKQKFIDVLSDKITLEDANDWASKLMQEEELENLIYVPLTDRYKIWEGIMYLYIFDLQTAPGEYFYCKEDIIDAFIKNFGSSPYEKEL